MLFILFVVFIILIYYIFFSDKNISESKNPSMEINDQKKTDTPQKIIVWYKEKEYDITNFVRKHPGGKQVLLENNGKDIGNLMIENDHSSNAYNILEKYIIEK